MFDPKTDKFPYPEQTDGHYLKLKMDRGIVFDGDYPFVDNSRIMRVKSKLFRAFVLTVVAAVVRVRIGLRVEGRRHLKEHKEELCRGAVSCCNHVHMWDYLAIVSAIAPFDPHVLIWAANINGEWGKAMRLIGGVPIPEDSTRATRAYLRAVKQYVQDGGWLHIYAEGSMWEYYRPIRPFKSGVGYFACETDKPVMPLAFTYRRPGWLRRCVFGQLACLTLHIGEPIFPNKELPRRERMDDLTVRSHEAVCRLAGIEPEENLYGPVFNDDKRVDYYTDTYGVGYKGSW